MRASRQPFAIGVGLIAVGLLVTGRSGLHAQSDSRSHVVERGGEQIYKQICQACHMPDAKGAVGAGAYPALAGNPKLVGRIYPVFVVINGLKAMPAFGSQLSDQQIADVVNYTRSHFGNAYTDEVTVGEVQALRPKT